MKARSAIILFAKAPTAGKVKTRLAGALSPLGSAKLYAAFLRDSIEIVQAAKAGQRTLAFTPPDAEAAMRRLAPREFTLFAQRGGDLGERMANAFSHVFADGFRRVAMIGADTPTLPPAFLGEAFDALRSAEVALGPALDGGYYLVGLSRPCPDLFRQVSWSTPKVLAQTLRNLRRARLSLHVLPPWYDVDSPQQMQFLAAHLAALRAAGDTRTARHTARILVEQAGERFPWPKSS